MDNITINMNVNDVIDVMGIAWLKQIRRTNEVSRDNALMKGDVEDCQRLIDAVDEVLAYLGVKQDD